MSATPRRPRGGLFLALVLLAEAEAAFAADAAAPAFAGAIGAYGRNVYVYGAQVEWASHFGAGTLARFGLEPRALAQVVDWRGGDHPTAHPSLVDTSLLAVVRRPFAPAADAVPFVEAGFGFHLLSHTCINDDRQLGSAFQFGSLLAAGIAFGPARRWELAGFVHHVSNARIAPPNDGLTYGGLVLRVALP